MIEIVALQARISESSPHDLRGVEMLAHALPPALETSEPERIHGRQGPFGHTPWEEDLAASRAVLAGAGERLRAILERGGCPLMLATDCALALATLPAVAERVLEARVLWLDAHTDYDTPATTTIGFLGCMSLSGACGAWDSGLGSTAAERVVHHGARIEPGDFDERGHRDAQASELTLVPPGRTAGVVTALGGAPVYVHLDPDVLDPSANPVPYGRPGGLSAEGLGEVLDAVAAACPVVGVEITAFHAPDEHAERDRLTALLTGATRLLLRRPPT